jgi:pentatricopeptide repeat protein
VTDSAFLAGMLDHYISLKDTDHAFSLLKRMCELGMSSKHLSDRQRSVARLLAGRDSRDVSISEPWKLLDSYTGKNKWYRSFNWSYKFTWLSATGWKITYWPFIWKNLSFTLQNPLNKRS